MVNTTADVLNPGRRSTKCAKKRRSQMKVQLDVTISLPMKK